MVLRRPVGYKTAQEQPYCLAPSYCAVPKIALYFLSFLKVGFTVAVRTKGFGFWLFSRI